MSITYGEALGTLEAMFTDGGWNPDQLDTVLRHEKGHMENTVDLILQHGTKDPDVLIHQLDAGIDPQQSILALDEQLARTLSQQVSIRQPSQRTSASSQQSQRPLQPQGIGTFTVLPDDFLCIPNYRSSASSMSDDEALARMLQDELFTEELRRNPDFAHLAGSNSRTSAGNAQRALRQGATNHSSSLNSSTNSLSNPFANFSTAFKGNNSSTTNQNNNQNNNLMEKLNEMGEGAKKRLQIMASQFQQAQAVATAKLTGNNNNYQDPPSSAHAAASERRSLLDDNDDMELAARKDL